MFRGVLEERCDPWVLVVAHEQPAERTVFACAHPSDRNVQEPAAATAAAQQRDACPLGRPKARDVGDQVERPVEADVATFSVERAVLAVRDQQALRDAEALVAQGVECGGQHGRLDPLDERSGWKPVPCIRCAAARRLPFFIEQQLQHFAGAHACELVDGLDARPEDCALKGKGERANALAGTACHCGAAASSREVLGTNGMSGHSQGRAQLVGRLEQVQEIPAGHE